MSISHAGVTNSGGMKSHRFNRALVEEDKKVNKLKLENGILTEKFKAINYQIDQFVKQHLS
jgi:hypothetical protein